MLQQFGARTQNVTVASTIKQLQGQLAREAEATRASRAELHHLRLLSDADRKQRKHILTSDTANALRMSGGGFPEVSSAATARLPSPLIIAAIAVPSGVPVRKVQVPEPSCRIGTVQQPSVSGRTTASARRMPL